MRARISNLELAFQQVVVEVKRAPFVVQVGPRDKWSGQAKSEKKPAHANLRPKLHLSGRLKERRRK